jgi:putative transposase
MKSNLEIHHRRSVRLKGYDYSRAGAYFVTICVENKINLFWKSGERSEEGENMVSPVHGRLNEVGLMVDKWWRKMFEKFHKEIQGDEYAIMPNHMHGIIRIVGANPCIRPNNNSKISNQYKGIGQFVSWFKRMSSNEYIRNVKNEKWRPFGGRFWQRNYYEHIIRDENDLTRICEYIISNPANWHNDKNNPAKKS